MKTRAYKRTNLIKFKKKKTTKVFAKKFAMTSASYFAWKLFLLIISFKNQDNSKSQKMSLIFKG